MHPVNIFLFLNDVESLTAQISHNSFPAEHTPEKIVFILSDWKWNYLKILV